MAIQIPPALIEYILLGSGDSRRHLQDLADSRRRLDGLCPESRASQPRCLITSYKEATATELAADLCLRRKLERSDEDDPEIAPLQGFVAAKLKFGELLEIVVPMTQWWRETETKSELENYRPTTRAGRMTPGARGLPPP